MTGLDEILNRIGGPIPCAICHTPTPAAQLSERTAPAALAFDGTVVVDRLVWVCPRCPLP